MTRHKTWRLPERRVRKLVRQHYNADWDHSTTSSCVGDDDESVVSTMSSVGGRSIGNRARGVVKRVGKAFRPQHPEQLQESPRPSDKKEPDSPDTPRTFDTGTTKETIALKTPPTTFTYKDSSEDAASPKDVPFLPEATTRAQDVGSNAIPYYDPIVVELEDGSVIYNDDNDGKKQGGLCEPCEGCNIL
jgi:hypothetical protein